MITGVPASKTHFCILITLVEIRILPDKVFIKMFLRM
jgi:hypothetical protein